jgi:hypothetical protein
VTNAQNKSGSDSPTFVARLTADEAPARRIANFMAESLDPAEVVCAAFERRDGTLGKVQMLGKPVREALCRRLVAEEAGDRGISGAVHTIRQLFERDVTRSPLGPNQASC